MTEANGRSVEVHPAAALRDVAGYLELPEHLLSIVSEFKIYLEVPHQFAPEGLLPIYLAAVAGYELPKLPEGNRWIEMPDSFAQPYLQREILRAAYEFLMG